MSEQDKRRGPQGVQGVQGVEGIEGQGTQGIQGKQGERGMTGARGRGVLPRNITLSFGIVVLVAFIILGIFALQARETRQLGRENRRVIEENRRVVESLCNTTQTLDAALVVPFLVETNLLLKFTPAGEGRERLVRQRNNLTIAHDELSATQNCEEVR